MKFDLCRAKLKGKRGMYSRSDVTQKLLSCTRSVILQGANAVHLTPSCPPGLYNFRTEKCTHTPANSTFSGSKTNLILILCVLMKILSHNY